MQQRPDLAAIEQIWRTPLNELGKSLSPAPPGLSAPPGLAPPQVYQEPRPHSESMAESVASACLEDEVLLSVMVRNLPNRAKLEHLCGHIAEMGLRPCVGAVHLPVDPRTGVNKGYAFVSVAAENAQHFMDSLEGTQVQGFMSQKRISACLADKQNRALGAHPKRAARQTEL